MFLANPDAVCKSKSLMCKHEHLNNLNELFSEVRRYQAVFFTFAYFEFFDFAMKQNELMHFYISIVFGNAILGRNHNLKTVFLHFFDDLKRSFGI